MCVFFPDILACIIAINFAEVEWRSIFAKLRAAAVKMLTRWNELDILHYTKGPLQYGPAAPVQQRFYRQVYF